LGWDSEFPDSIVEGEKMRAKLVRNINKEREGKRKGKTRRRIIGRKKGEKKVKLIATPKENTASTMNDGAETVDVDNRVFRVVAKETLGDIIDRNLVLVTHTARSGERVVKESKVMEKKRGRRTTGGKREGGGYGLNAGIMERRCVWEVGRDKRSDLFANMSGGFEEINIFDHGLVYARACAFEKRSENTRLSDMAIPPEVNRRSVPVFYDKLAVGEAYLRKVVVVRVGMNIGRAGGKQGDIDRP
jgi:hypothetical protein